MASIDGLDLEYLKAMVAPILEKGAGLKKEARVLCGAPPG